MNKTDLERRLAKSENLPYAYTKRLTTKLVDIIYSAIQKGEDIKITGLGTIKVVERGEREGVDPITLKRIKISARKSVKFIPSNQLKRDLNQ